MHREFFTLNDLDYLVQYPNGYQAGEKYPVLFVLHGAGTRGRDMQLLQENAFFVCTEQYTDFPFVVVAPQCNKETWFDHFETLQQLVKQIAAAPFSDRERMYAIGPSMGGYGTWQLAMSIPEYFAAIVPICGGGMYWDAYRLHDVPVWAFHGDSDGVVFVEESQKMVNAVNNSGGNAKLTIYPGGLHNAWTATYENYAVFEWLLSHRNAHAPTQENAFNDGKQFG